MSLFILSVAASRNSYDAQLASLNSPVTVSEQSTPANITLKPTVEALYLRSEATSLRADAASLRADAILLRADALSRKVAAGPLEEAHYSPLSMVKSAFSNLTSSLKRLLLIFGTLAAMGMALQVVFLLFAGRQSESAMSEASKSEEKLYLQEYYQVHGVRPASRIEADLLDAENRRKENDQRKAEREEREKTRLEEETSRFAEESRRSADKISENLRRDEERLRHEEERKQEKLEQEKRRMEREEIDRIEREKARWRGNSYQSPYSNE